MQDIKVVSEDTIDTRTPMEFMAFIGMAGSFYGTNQTTQTPKFDVRSLALNLFDIENMQILQTLCCSPTLRDLKTLAKNSFSLCRISDPETTR